MRVPILHFIHVFHDDQDFWQSDGHHTEDFTIRRRSDDRPEQSPGNEDHEKASLIKLLVKQVLESPNKNQLMAELFPKNDDKEYEDISEDFKNIVEEQGNIEAHELFMITDAMRCQTCCHYGTLGHTHIAYVDRQNQEKVGRSQ